MKFLCFLLLWEYILHEGDQKKQSPNMSWEALFCMKDELERIAYPNLTNCNYLLITGTSRLHSNLDLKLLNGLH